MQEKGKLVKKPKSISSKLSLRVLTILVPSLLLLIIVACMMAASALEQLNQEKLEAQTNYAVSLVDGFFENKLAAAELISVNPAVKDYMHNTKTIADLQAYVPLSALLQQLEDMTQQLQDEKVQALWLVSFANEQMLFSTGERTAAELNSADWDDLLLEEKRSVVCDPYIDPLTGESTISIVAPVFAANGSDIAGAVGLDVHLGTLNEELGDIKVGQAGYLELLSRDSVYIVSDDPSAIGRNVADLEIDDAYKENIKNRYEGIMTFAYAGIKYRSLSCISDATNWLSVATLPQAEIDVTRNHLVIVMVLLSVILLIALTLILIGLVHKMLKPLAQVGHNIKEFANGDLNVEIKVQTEDEIGQLAQDARELMATFRFIIEDIQHIMQEMALGNFAVVSKNLDYYKGDFNAIIVAMRDLRNRMNVALLQIEQSAGQVSAGSEQVSSGSQALSQGATEQASAVEELAATINEISEQIKSTSAHADAARTQTAQAGSEITTCNEQMHEMIAAMGEISEKSGKIGKIIKTIEDIAFQTNILALNAAVEAARAGVAGKGFAVVADEVRNLAAKSAEASKSTSSLIASTVEAVDKGKEIANITGKSLNSVVDSAADVVASVDQIALATQQQATSVQQVTQGIEQISGVVQTNSATAEEAAAASEELSSQAQLLKNLVAQFELIKESKPAGQQAIATPIAANALQQESNKY